MWMRRRVFVGVCVLVAACGKPSPQVPSEAEKTAAALSGDHKGKAADNPHCQMFTPQEVATFSGKSMEDGQNAAMGSGCQWLATDGKGSAMVQVIPATYHSPASAAPGFKELRDIGERGFLVPETNGWAAGAIQGEASVNVSTPPGATEASTVAFLREAMKRSAK